jgi:hypothetical protein
MGLHYKILQDRIAQQMTDFVVSKCLLFVSHKQYGFDKHPSFLQNPYITDK